MPRVPQVTRTIQTTKATIMCLDTEKGETFEQEITLSRTYKDDRAILRQAEKVVGTGSIKLVYVVKSSVEEALYGLTEQDFIKLATVLPARGAKPTNGTETTEAINN